METEGTGGAGHRPRATDIPQFDFLARDRHLEWKRGGFDRTISSIIMANDHFTIENHHNLVIRSFMSKVKLLFLSLGPPQIKSGLARFGEPRAAAEYPDRV
jgi:hypothetical protein